MKIATIVSLAHPFVILIFTAISSYVWVYAPEFVESEGGWLNNLVSMVSVKCYMNILLLLLTTVPVLKD